MAAHSRRSRVLYPPHSSPAHPHLPIAIAAQTLLAAISFLETNGVYSELALLALYLDSNDANSIAMAALVSTNRAASIIQFLFIVLEPETSPFITANIWSSSEEDDDDES